MVEPDLSSLKLRDLLDLQVGIFEELRSREITRTDNIPTADLAEFIFCRTYGWEIEASSKKGYDALIDGNKTVQIKARRCNKRNGSRQLSQIRDLDGFDFLAGVLFNHDYSIMRAAIMPNQVVEDQAKRNDYTNSYKFLLRDSVWDDPRVEDVTDQLSKTMDEL